MKKLTSVLLSFILAFSLVGSAPAVWAEDRASDSDQSQEMKEPERLEEITELRTISSKTYRLSDGGYRYVAYAGPIHYLDGEGVYREIDTSLVESKDRAYLYTNAANSWNVSFGENEIKLTIDGQSIVFSLPGRSAASVKPAKDMTGRKNGYFEEKKNADNAIVYSYNGFDVVYSVLTGRLQEDIVISDREALQDFSFIIRVSDGLKISDKDGLTITDKSGTAVFRFTEPYMYDANGNMSEAVVLDYTATDEEITVSIRPDSSFFSEDTEYPVVIVPRSSLPTTPASQDTCVDEGYPNLNYHAQSLWTGGAAGVNRKRTFIQFALPSTVNSNQITRARIRLKRSDKLPPNINAFAIDQTWNDSSVTWNDQPTYITGYWSPASVSEGNDWYSVDVTEMICYYMVNSNWYYGFVLKEIQESNSDQKTKFYSSEAAAGNRPELCVDFVNSLGSRPYQNVQSGGYMNCMGYALEFSAWIDDSDPDFEVIDSEIDGLTAEELTDYIFNASIAWLRTKVNNGEYAYLSNYDANIYTAYPGWFRVALKVGFDDFNGNGFYDPGYDDWGFHWWYQTNTLHGLWAEKPGGQASQMIGTSGIDPSEYDWDMGWDYTGTARYLQIKDIRSFQ